MSGSVAAGFDGAEEVCLGFGMESGWNCYLED